MPKNFANGFIPRPYQKRIVNNIVNNLVGDKPNPRGVISAATNSGKTLILSLLYLTMGRPKTAVIINDTELYTQALEEIPPLIGEATGFIQPNRILWGNFMICKVKTLSNRLSLKEVRDELAEYELVVVDECDLADNKTYKGILKHFYNAYSKVGMSGSVFVSTLAKDKLKNQNIKSYFGSLLDEITNKDLIELGHSSDVICTFTKGNVSKVGLTYSDEYNKAIVKNKQRNKKVLKRVTYRLSKGHFPMLVVCRFHKHVEILHKLIAENYGNKYKIEWVHHQRKERAEIVKSFKEGKIDILVTSLILKRGKNFPHMYALINAASGDSHEQVLQILGRAMRVGRGNKKYYDDFFDGGKYLKRHSKHRVIYCKKQGLTVKEIYKNKTT